MARTSSRKTSNAGQGTPAGATVSAGGPVGAGGYNFHAVVGRPLHWLEGLVSDAPLAVRAETGGGGVDEPVGRDADRAHVRSDQGDADSHGWIGGDERGCRKHDIDQDQHLAGIGVRVFRKTASARIE